MTPKYAKLMPSLQETRVGHSPRDLHLARAGLARLHLSDGLQLRHIIGQGWQWRCGGSQGDLMLHESAVCLDSTWKEHGKKQRAVGDLQTWMS